MLGVHFGQRNQRGRLETKGIGLYDLLQRALKFFASIRGMLAATCRSSKSE